MYALSDKELVFHNNTPIDLGINVEKAIPIGLIITEMTTNSIKYAEHESSEPKTISIFIEDLESNFKSITFRDNGPGLPEDFTLENSNTLGTQLISALVEQLDGELSYHNDSGAVFQFTFKN